MILKNEKCLSCKYKDWDCKNCNFEEDFELDKINIMFDIIMTRKCNFRCSYCWIDFTDDFISEDTINNFINYIKNNRANFNEIRIEFFWWEPLLEFEKIKLIVENTYLLWIKYIIVTNWKLFSDEILEFLEKYNFDVVFSISLFNSVFLDEQKTIFKKYDISKYIINFIIEPKKELQMYEVFKKLITLWFKRFNMLPAHYTIEWSEENLGFLDILLEKINKVKLALNNRWYNINIYYWRSGDELDKWIIKEDIEFILDYDWSLYWDYEAELYILNDIVPNSIFTLEDIYIDNINNRNLNFFDAINKRKSFKPEKHLDNITNYLWINQNLLKLWEVMAKNNTNK